MRTVQKIWPKVGRRRTEALFKLHRSKLSTVVVIITAPCEKLVCLEYVVNEFCRSCRDGKEKEETVLRLLCTGSAHCRRRKRQHCLKCKEASSVLLWWLLCTHVRGAFVLTTSQMNSVDDVEMRRRRKRLSFIYCVHVWSFVVRESGGNIVLVIMACMLESH